MTQSLRTHRKSTDKEANEMASSNDIEVLDPTASVEKLKNIVSKVALNRRHFMAALGAAGIAAGTGLVTRPDAHAQQPTPTGFLQVDVLNFLLNVVHLVEHIEELRSKAAGDG
jgi:secreted PhoX family phosphatase